MAWRTNTSNISLDNLRVTGSPASYNTLVYLHGDHLGSIGAVTNSNGALLDMTRFLPFGGFRGSDPAFLTECAFTGHKANNTSSNDLGLIYMNARFYSPYINRFLSADSIVPDPANPQSFNGYSYSLNNPVRFSDPTGHCASEQFDTECWAQYDALFNQFLLNNYSEEDILELIGTGENYRYKNEERYRDGKNIVGMMDRYINCGSDFDCSNNAPRSWDPYEHTCGWQYWTDCYEQEPLFDFLALNFSFGPGIGPAFSVIRDKYGNVYFTIGAQVGVPTGLAGSVAGGKLTDGLTKPPLDNVSESLIENTLPGFSEGLSAGAGPGVSVSVNKFSNNPVPLQVGIFSPQLSYTFAFYTWIVYDAGSSTPWIWQKDTKQENE